MSTHLFSSESETLESVLEGVINNTYSSDADRVSNKDSLMKAVKDFILSSEKEGHWWGEDSEDAECGYTVYLEVGFNKLRAEE